MLLLLLACTDLFVDETIPVPCSARASFYPDADGDGAGDALAPYIGCEQPEGYVVTAGDCDDTDPLVQACDTGDTGDSGDSG